MHGAVYPVGAWAARLDTLPGCDALNTDRLGGLGRSIGPCESVLTCADVRKCVSTGIRTPSTRTSIRQLYRWCSRGGPPSGDQPTTAPPASPLLHIPSLYAHLRLSVTDFRTSLVQAVRDARAPQVQDRSGMWVGHGRRARAGRRPRLRRPGRLESRRLHVLTPHRLSFRESVAGTLCRALAWQVVQGRLPARHGRRASSRRAPGHQARRHRQSFRRREPRLEHSARCAQPLVSSLTPLWVPNLTPIASSFGRWLW